MKNKNVPELRFAGFEEDWKEKKLGEVTEILDGDRGKSYPSESDFTKKGHTMFLNTSNTTKNGFSFEFKQYITKFKSDSMGNGKLDLNDIILTSRGTLGNVVLYNSNIQKQAAFARINSGMLILRSKTRISTDYIVQYLKSPLGLKQIKQIGFGSAQPQLTKKGVTNYTIEIPIFEEQTKIGNFFKQLDDTISIYQQELETLKQTKQGFLQKMFPKEGEVVPELRFAGFSGDWERVLARKVFISISDKNHGHLPILSASQEKGMVYRSENGIDIAYDKNTTKNYKRVLVGQFVMHLRSFQGGFAYSKIEGITSPAYTILDFIDKESQNQLFWKNVFTSKKFIKHLETITYGIRDGRSISFSDFSTLKFNVPTIEEQTKIGNFFKQLDDLIALKDCEVETLKETKKAFLQKMFI